MKKGKCFVISAPSGAGKSTLISKVVADKPGIFYYSVSDTTRRPREGEVDGKDYNFITIPEFKLRIDSGYHAEWAEVHDNYYGTPKGPLFKAMDMGKYPLLDIDVQGFLRVKKNMPSDKLCSIFILPPSVKELKRRLLGRGDTVGADLETRLRNAKGEMGYTHEFNHTMINNDLERAYSELKRIIEDEIEY